MKNLQFSRSARRAPRPRLSVQTLEAREVPAAFSPGNLVIYRVSDGTATLTGNGNAIFLDEYTPDGALVQSIALPTTDPDGAGPQRQIIAGGTATAEGLMTRSGDGNSLVLTGYARDLAGTPALSGTTPTAVPRVIARVDGSGNVDTSLAITDGLTGAPRGVATQDGSNFWFSSQNDGVRHIAAGGTTSIRLNDTVLTMRYVAAINGQLYTSANTGSFRLGTVGTGLPITAGQDIVNLPGFATTGSPYGFFFADLDAGVAGFDTLYVADDTNTAGVGGIAKWSLVGGNWVSNGVAGTASNAYRGLTGVVNGSTVTLYATRAGSELVSLTDATGYNATIPTNTISGVLASAGTNKAFRGIALTPVNSAPVNTVPTNFTTVEDNSTVLPGLSVADADAGTASVKVTLSVPAASATLTVNTSVTNGVTAAQVTGNGTSSVVITAPVVVINKTLADAAGLTYAPTANAYGDVTLTMTTDDQGNTGSGGAKTDTDNSTVSVTPVIDDPTVTDATTDEDVQNTTGLVFTRNAVDGAEVSHVRVTNITGGALFQNNGTTPINEGDFITYAEANAGLKFTPPTNFSGTASFQVQASTSASAAGLGGTVRTATIAVNAVNDAPQATVPGDQSSVEDTVITFSLAGENQIRVGDVDAGGNPLKLTLTATNGTVVLSGTTGLTDISGWATSELTATGTAAALNAALEGMTYTPDFEFNGPATLRVHVDDQGFSGSGGPQTHFMVTNINVAAVNDFPDVVGPSGPTVVPANEDEPFWFAGDFGVFVFDPDSGTGAILATLNSTHGTMVVTDVPSATITGNGTAAITIAATVDDLNAALDGLTFTPDADYFGPAAITMTTDDQGNSGGPAETDSDTFAINVDPVNDAPVLGDFTFFVNAAATPGSVVGTVTATDVESDGISYAITAGNADGKFAINATSGQITVVDPSNLAPTYTLTITATDNGTPSESDTGTVTINRNTAPTGSIPSQTVDEDAPAVTLNLADFFSDPEQAASSLGYSFTIDSNPGLFQSAVLQGTNLLLTPAADANGSAGLTVTATDVGGLTGQATFTFTVNAVNDAPTIDALGDLNLAEDAAEQTINLTGLSAGPVNESETLTITATSSNTALFDNPTATYTGGPTGSLTFTPKPNANGVATVTVSVSDGNQVVTEDFVVLVGAAPDRPVIDTTFTPLLPAIKLPIPKGTQPEGGPVTTLTAHVADPDGDPTGVAITKVDAAAGTWEFFNGTTWSPITNVSDTNALLLPADAVAKVRLLPAPTFRNKYASLSFRAWDQTAGTAFQLNPIDVGTDTSISTQTERAWIAVGKPRPIVDAAGHPNLTPVRPLKEDRTSAAFPTKNFLTFLGIEAKEAAPTVKAFGVAVSGATGGTWQFNTGKGGWRPLGVVSDGSALLLRPTDRVRLIPTPNFSGTATLIYHTWDQAAGTAGQPANTSASGFSADTEAAVLTIAAVNDAPVVTQPPALGTLAPGATTTARTVADFLLLGIVSDVDSLALGIQLLPASSAIGVWQFKNATGDWVDVKRPTLLTPDVEIRFQAKATARPGTYSLAFKVWDQTGPSGTALSKLAKVTLTIA